MIEINRLVNTLESGDVLRYHAAPGVTKQTDAHHQWGVAVLALFIFPDLEKSLLVECLLHDTGELVSGDVPFTAKRYSEALGDACHEVEAKAREADMLPNISDCTSREMAILKICDTLDGLIWCVHNETVIPTVAKGMHRGRVLERWCGAYERCREKFADFLSFEEWERADAVYEKYTGAILTANPALANAAHE